MSRTATPCPLHAGCIQVSDVTHKLLEGEALEYTGGVDVKGKGRMDTYVWTPPALALATTPRPISGPPEPDSPSLAAPSESGGGRRFAMASRTSLCSLKTGGMQQMLASSPTSKKQLSPGGPLPPRVLRSKKQMDISQIVNHVLTKIKTQGKPKPSSAP